jgi:hypothetical protein
MGLESEIRDPEKNLFRIPDPGVKRHRIPDSDPQHCLFNLMYEHTVYDDMVPYLSGWMTTLSFCEKLIFHGTVLFHAANCFDKGFLGHY